ncbi:MAG TPA: serine hydrolase domain-containing protein [Verrucomicrobiae bacterium]|jgi:CubicO group peptidase (beta-lactamase class C family)|nr:serine hydrolase domain-containing protein [Verrucomicrobiae bacterium]
MISLRLLRTARFNNLVFFLFLLSAKAGVSDSFVLLDNTNGFYASPEVPESAVSALKEAQNNNYEIKSFAFTPIGDWIDLNDKSFKVSDTGLDMYKNLNDTYHHHNEELGWGINCVAITGSGSWINCYQHGLYGSGGNPAGAWGKYQELGKSGHVLRSLAYGPEGGWVIQYDKSSNCYEGISADLVRILDQAASNKIPIQCVAFSGTNWICLAHNTWWTSDPNLPAAKIIGEKYNAGLHPKWIAFVPNYGPFNPSKFGAMVREAMDGKIAGGYECVVIDHGKVVVELAGGWARAPWETVDPAVKMTVNMHMDIASVSKTITATAILKLWEESAGTSHQFSLDDPFWPYISSICPNVNEDVKKITIREVMRHRGGFTNDFGNNPQALRRLLALPLPYPPGTHFQYRNVNYYIIHLLIEKISQLDCTTYVKTHVLMPMGITDMDSSYHDKPSILCYGDPDNKDAGANVYHGNNSAFVGPGGWYASAMDLGKFLEGIRQYRVLSPATTVMMFKENLGWDWGNPEGPWGKGGLAPGPKGSKFVSGILYCSDGVEIVILANCAKASTQTLPVKAWKEARY